MKRVFTRGGRLITARPWISATVAVVLVAGGITAYAVVGASSGSSSASAATTTTRLVTASTGTIKQSVSATGTLAPADEHDVSFGSAATITSVRVTQGEKVTKGQVLGTIDTTSLKADLAQARANLASAKATLASAEDASSTTDAQLSADKANVTSERSSVTAAEDALTDATLRSPISGTVAEVNVAKGDTASGSGSSTTTTSSTSSPTSSSGSSSGSSGSSGGSGTTVGSSSGSTGDSGSTGSSSSGSSSSADFVIVGLRSWTVSASLDDTEIGDVAKGDQVQLITDAATGSFFGIVSAVSVLSSDSSGSASYPVTIAVTGSPSGLHDGASVTAAVIYKQLTNVLTVASGAVHRDGTSTYVEAVKDGKKVKTTVRTGITSGGLTQITSGLTSGTQVYEQVVTASRTGTGNRTSTSGNQNSGNFPGGGTGGGNFPGGGTGGGFGGGTGGGR